MAGLAIFVVIIACAAYQYRKGTLLKSFAAVMITICASIIAFSYFEILANVFISRGASGRYPALVPWAQPLCFVLLFVLAFAIMQTITGKLTRQAVDLGRVPERIGRVVCGILFGLVLAGSLLTALAMAPLPNKYPYQRFDATRPDAEKPNKVLLNVDGFVTGLFGTISNGSFSSQRSFAALHPAFLDQAFLNRHNFGSDIPIVTRLQAIEVPRKKAAWYAPQGLRYSNGKPVLPKTGHSLTIVRVGIKRNTIRGGRFTLSQLRLVCKQKRQAENPLTGKAMNIYPVGYLRTANQLQTKRLNDMIEIKNTDFESPVKPIDFAFYVPNDFQPVLVQFKQNSIAKVPPLVPVEQAPPTVPFIQLSNCAINVADLNPVTSAKVYGLQLATGAKFLAGLKLKLRGKGHWQSSQTPRSIRPAQFDDEEINYARAALKIVEPTKAPKSKEKMKPIGEMLKPLRGYELLSLKCNKPSTGIVIKARQLPVLVELSGLIHHPVGVIASGKLGNQTTYEVDYCSLTAENVADGLTIAEDSSVARPFPDTVWLTEQAQSISEFYTLYLVKKDRKAIITGVRPGDSQTTAGFRKYEAFLIR